MSGPWHTSGTSIVDSAGDLVRIAGVTWYGMESSRWVPAGLEFQPYTTIMDEVKLLGFNTIRLPFSNELVERNPTVIDAVAANPQFRGQHALGVMDAIAGYAQRIGLKLILDDHRSAGAPPLEVNSLNEPLWYTQRYSESAWIHDWETLARRYADNDAVVGFDLRNEPHTAGPGPWNLRAYLRQGATWGPFMGVSDPATDWRAAAQRAGNAVLAINPHLLIVVQGMQLYPSGTGSKGVLSSWWAGILTPVKHYPVVLRVPHQLVYSVHQWGPRKSRMPWFKNMTYASLKAAWRNQWSFLLDAPTSPNAAPIWIGEFGTCNRSSECVDRQQPDNQAMWFQALAHFLNEYPTVGWSFYALNGTNSNRCRTDNGLLNDKWNRLSRTSLYTTLASVEASPPPPGTIAQRGLLIPGATTSMKPRDAHSQLCSLP